MKTTFRRLLAAACAAGFSPASAQTTLDWTSGLAIPDNNPVGLADTRTVSIDPSLVITGLEVRLETSGGWNGDLYASLVHDSGFTVLLNRVGKTSLNPAGSASSGFDVTFTDSAATDIHTGIGANGLVTGTWQPDARTADPSVVTDLSTRGAFLSSFNEVPVNGSWTLFLADNAAVDTSTLVGWGLTIFSESRAFAIWDANGNTSGIGGNGTWSSTSATWATSNVGTSTAAQATASQLVFDGGAGTVTIDGMVAPSAGLRFKSTGYQLTGGTVGLAGLSAAANNLVTDPAVTATVASTLAGTNGLTKSGAGTLVLSCTNTYSGPTVIHSGTLVLDTSGTISHSGEIIVGDAGSSGAVLDVSAKTGGFTIAADQILTGSGVIDARAGETARDVVIAGSHAPGNSAGLQSVDGNLLYSTGSIFEWDLSNSATGVRGSQYDGVNVNGTVSGSGAIFKVLLNSGSFSDSFWDVDQSWADIFKSGLDGTGSALDISGIFSSFDGNGVGANGVVTGRGTFSITGSTLQWTAVPEPGGAVVGLLLAAGGLRRRRVRSAS